jgi:hypothetical protein
VRILCLQCRKVFVWLNYVIIILKFSLSAQRRFKSFRDSIPVFSSGFQGSGVRVYVRRFIIYWNKWIQGEENVFVAPKSLRVPPPSHARQVACPTHVEEPYAMAYFAYVLIRLWSHPWDASHQLRTTGLEIPPELKIISSMRGIQKDALRREERQCAVVVVTAVV